MCNTTIPIPGQDDVFLVATDPPAQETLEKMQKRVEQALSVMWRVGLTHSGMSPWRVFYACLASQLPITVTYVPSLAIRDKNGQIRTIGRLAETNGSRISMNAAMGCDMEPDHIAAIIFHELEHIVRRHHSRLAGRDLALWNQACDYVINAQLAAEGFHWHCAGPRYMWEALRDKDGQRACRHPASPPLGPGRPETLKPHHGSTSRASTPYQGRGLVLHFPLYADVKRRLNQP